MNVLIIGLGYAGTRFLNAFLSLEAEYVGMQVAYTSRRRTNESIPYFESVSAALKLWTPAITVVTASDGAHAEVLAQLDGYTGFVICEKPLVNARDDLRAVAHQMRRTSGFCMNLIERYSEVSDSLKRYVRDNGLSLIRANFIWGKDRIHDARMTCGVPSEIIHGLDLVEWIAAPQERLLLCAAIGTRSDFSISGDDVLDSVALTATLGKASVTGYSSFVNIERQRTVDFIFSSPERELIYARLVFDSPSWDMDHLSIWKRCAHGDDVISEVSTSFPAAPEEWNMIQKLRRLVKDVLEFTANGKAPKRPFADLCASSLLQDLLNSIERTALTVGTVKYVLGDTRPVFVDDSNLERLG